MFENPKQIKIKVDIKIFFLVSFLFFNWYIVKLKLKNIMIINPI